MVTLHLYAPRQNREFKCLDRLDLFTEGKSFDRIHLPAILVLQLNLFAGQLYLSSFKEYTEVCEFLGLSVESSRVRHCSRSRWIHCSDPWTGQIPAEPRSTSQGNDDQDTAKLRGYWEDPHGKDIGRDLTGRGWFQCLVDNWGGHRRL